MLQFVTCSLLNLGFASRVFLTGKIYCIMRSRAVTKMGTGTRVWGRGDARTGTRDWGHAIGDIKKYIKYLKKYDDI